MCEVCGWAYVEPAGARKCKHTREAVKKEHDEKKIQPEVLTEKFISQKKLVKIEGHSINMEPSVKN